MQTEVDIQLGNKLVFKTKSSEDLKAMSQVPFQEARTALDQMKPISCTYLIYLGIVSKLSESFVFPDDISPDAFVCKYGKSINLCSRLCQHNSDYGKIIGGDIQLMFYTKMTKNKLDDAEKQMQKIFCTNGMRRVLIDKNGNKRQEIIVFKKTEQNISNIIDIFRKARKNAKDKRLLPKQPSDINDATICTGNKFKCNCGKTYAQRCSLNRHRARTGCGNKLHVELLFKLKTSEDKLAAMIDQYEKRIETMTNQYEKMTNQYEKRIATMTNQYEDKLMTISSQIIHTREDKNSEIMYLREELNKANSKLEKLMERITAQHGRRMF